ncbi:MAG TPA: hypothetical protein VGD22_07125 [Sphingobacteriaceae bacterium]
MEKKPGLQLREESVFIPIRASFDFLKQLSNNESYIIRSRYPTINNTTCQIKMSDEWVAEISEASIEGGKGFQPADFQHFQYGFGREFTLVNKSRVFSVPEGLSSFVFALGSTGEVSGSFFELINLRGNFENYLRLVFEISDTGFRLTDAYDTEPFKTETSFYGGGLLNFNVGNSKMRMFSLRENDKLYLVIDSLKLIRYAEFTEIVNAILISNGVCSGTFQRGKAVILFSTAADFTKIADWSYIKYAKSKLGGGVIRPMDLGQLISGVPRDRRAVPPMVLGNVATLALKKPEFSRALSIICESSDTAIEVRTATYCVAMETLRNYILGDEMEYNRPIKSRKTATQIRQSLIKTLEEFSAEEFNDISSVRKKIDNINQYGNTEGFLKMFEVYNMRLSENDIETLKKRNDFLHGRIPSVSGAVEENRELIMVLLRLHLLLSALIMRMGGYLGYYSNNVRWKYPELSDEPVFRAFNEDSDLYYPPR